MKKKKGFTLIEIITVIAILSLLVIFVVQNVMKIYTESKEKIFILQSKTIYKYGNDKFMSDQLSGIESITYSSRGENKLDTKTDSEYNIIYENNKMKTFQVSNGEYSVNLNSEEIKPNDITNEVVKSKDEEGYIAVNEDLIDLTLPTNVALISTIKTTNSITLVGSAIDDESGISKYEFKIDNGNYIDNGIDNTYTFNGLSLESHTIYVRVTNGAGLTSEISIIEELIALVEPTYNVNPEGWATSKTITITYQERKEGLIYSYSIDEGSTWTEVPTGTTVDVAFNTNGSIIGKIYDGTNTVTSTYTVSQIYVPSSYESCFTVSGNSITAYSTAVECPKNVEIPPVINGTAITTIGNMSFASKSLTSVVVPEGVTTIGIGTFQVNQITSVTLPNSVTSIGQGAFLQNQLTSLSLPDSLITIGESAFKSNQLTNVIIPNNVTTIGITAFNKNLISNVSIPSSVTSIGHMAFNDNQLPDDQAFIYSRNIDGSKDLSSLVSYGGAKRSAVVIPSNVITIKNDALGSNNITSITIPSSVTTIEQYAFYGNKLTSVTIPSSVTTMGQYAFAVNQLTSVSIPNTITSLEPQVFYNNMLTSVTVPNKVTSIGNGAFQYNKMIQGNAKIDNSYGNVSLGTNVFANNGSTRTTTITPVYLR